MMFGRELRLPDQLQWHPLLTELERSHESERGWHRPMRYFNSYSYISNVMTEKSPFHLLLERWCRWKTNGAVREVTLKLNPNFVGPYYIREAYPNHFYLIGHFGQSSLWNECRLKPCFPRDTKLSQAPATIEPEDGRT